MCRYESHIVIFDYGIQSVHSKIKRKELYLERERKEREMLEIPTSHILQFYKMNENSERENIMPIYSEGEMNHEIIIKIVILIQDSYRKSRFRGVILYIY